MTWQTVLDSREKSLPGSAYKMSGGAAPYGLDCIIGDSSVFDESKMSMWIPFGSGQGRDGVGDVLEIGGIDLSRHRVNPIVLHDHGKGDWRCANWPIALAEDPQTHEYTVHLDPAAKEAKLNAFFYQGKGIPGADRKDECEFAQFAAQLYDLAVRRFIRGGSIGYQVIAARELSPDYETGTPKGLHLLKTLMLEGSLVVLPANMDTVVKVLSMPTVCGKKLSPYLVKSLSAYAPPKKAQLGYEGKAVKEPEVSNGGEVVHRTPNYYVVQRMIPPGHIPGQPPPYNRRERNRSERNSFQVYSQPEQEVPHNVTDTLEDAIHWADTAFALSQAREQTGSKSLAQIPNYKPASNDLTSCATCQAYSADEGGEGHCSMFKTLVRADHTCDDWEAKKSPDTNERPLKDEKAFVPALPPRLQVGDRIVMLPPSGRGMAVPQDDKVVTNVRRTLVAVNPIRYRNVVNSVNTRLGHPVEGWEDWYRRVGQSEVVANQRGQIASRYRLPMLYDLARLKHDTHPGILADRLEDMGHSEHADWVRTQIPRGEPGSSVKDLRRAYRRKSITVPVPDDIHNLPPVPPARWRPGVGAVKDLRAKYKAQAGPSGRTPRKKESLMSRRDFLVLAAAAGAAGSTELYLQGEQKKRRQEAQERQNHEEIGRKREQDRIQQDNDRRARELGVPPLPNKPAGAKTLQTRRKSQDKAELHRAAAVRLIDSYLHHGNEEAYHPMLEAISRTPHNTLLPRIQKAREEEAQNPERVSERIKHREGSQASHQHLLHITRALLTGMRPDEPYVVHRSETGHVEFHPNPEGSLKPYRIYQEGSPQELRDPKGNPVPNTQESRNTYHEAVDKLHQSSPKQSRRGSGRPGWWNGHYNTGTEGPTGLVVIPPESASTYAADLRRVHRSNAKDLRQAYGQKAIRFRKPLQKPPSTLHSTASTKYGRYSIHHAPAEGKKPGGFQVSFSLHGGGEPDQGPRLSDYKAAQRYVQLHHDKLTARADRLRPDDKRGRPPLGSGPKTPKRGGMLRNVVAGAAIGMAAAGAYQSGKAPPPPVAHTQTVQPSRKAPEAGSKSPAPKVDAPKGSAATKPKPSKGGRLSKEETDKVLKETSDFIRRMEEGEREIGRRQHTAAYKENLYEEARKRGEPVQESTPEFEKLRRRVRDFRVEQSHYEPLQPHRIPQEDIERKLPAHLRNRTPAGQGVRLPPAKGLVKDLRAAYKAAKRTPRAGRKIAKPRGKPFTQGQDQRRVINPLTDEARSRGFRRAMELHGDDPQYQNWIRAQVLGSRKKKSVDNWLRSKVKSLHGLLGRHGSYYVVQGDSTRSGKNRYEVHHDQHGFDWEFPDLNQAMTHARLRAAQEEKHTAQNPQAGKQAKLKNRTTHQALPFEQVPTDTGGEKALPWKPIRGLSWEHARLEAKVNHGKYQAFPSNYAPGQLPGSYVLHHNNDLVGEYGSVDDMMGAAQEHHNEITGNPKRKKRGWVKREGTRPREGTRMEGGKPAHYRGTNTRGKKPEAVSTHLYHASDQEVNQPKRAKPKLKPQGGTAPEDFHLKSLRGLYGRKSTRNPHSGLIRVKVARTKDEDEYDSDVDRLAERYGRFVPSKRGRKAIEPKTPRGGPIRQSQREYQGIGSSRKWWPKRIRFRQGHGQIEDWGHPQTGQTLEGVPRFHVVNHHTGYIYSSVNSYGDARRDFDTLALSGVHPELAEGFGEQGTKSVGTKGNHKPKGRFPRRPVHPTPLHEAVEERRQESSSHLYDYSTNERIRRASAGEIRSSEIAAEHDGGAGVINVNGRHCYVKFLTGAKGNYKPKGRFPRQPIHPTPLHEAVEERRQEGGSCECSDPGCPVHSGRERCHHRATMTLYRSDMEDETGTPMCPHCAGDALESGVFSTEPPDQEYDEEYDE